MKRFTPFINGMTEDKEGDWVRHEDALLYGSEQFGLGRIDGQADAQAVAKILQASSRPDPMSLRMGGTMEESQDTQDASAPKFEMLRWTHPDWDQWLLTDVSASHKDIAEAYLNGHPAPFGEIGLAGLKVHVVRMTQAEIDAIPEWDG